MINLNLWLDEKKKSILWYQIRFQDFKAQKFKIEWK